MIKSKVIRDNLAQILAITEKDIKLKIRFKFALIISFFNPFVVILMPIIILGQFFSFNADFGPWNSTNYFVFVILVYNVSLLKQIIMTFPQQFSREKYWETLTGLIIAPFNRIYLLFGIFLSHLVIISIPFAGFIIACWLFYPIMLPTIIFILIIFLLIALIFSGIGLIIGIFAISNENIYNALVFIMTFVFWFSCLSYPFEIFPGIIQEVINLNPFYYIFDFLRLVWIEDNIGQSILLHPHNFLILIGLAITLPSIGVFIFNKIYRKYGIVGY